MTLVRGRPAESRRVRITVAPQDDVKMLVPRRATKSRRRRGAWFGVAR